MCIITSSGKLVETVTMWLQKEQKKKIKPLDRSQLKKTQVMYSYFPTSYQNKYQIASLYLLGYFDIRFDIKSKTSGLS